MVRSLVAEVAKPPPPTAFPGDRDLWQDPLQQVGDRDLWQDPLHQVGNSSCTKQRGIQGAAQAGRCEPFRILSRARLSIGPILLADIPTTCPISS